MAGETKKSIKHLVKGSNPSPFATFAASLLEKSESSVEVHEGAFLTCFHCIGVSFERRADSQSR
jgi:hypothetical protein